VLVDPAGEKVVMVVHQDFNVKPSIKIDARGPLFSTILYFTGQHVGQDSDGAGHVSKRGSFSGRDFGHCGNSDLQLRVSSVKRVRWWQARVIYLAQRFLRYPAEG
jgi:hypothetical protein